MIERYKASIIAATALLCYITVITLIINLIKIL